MKDTIDIFELLESQHAEVDELLEQLESGEGDRARLFAELADKLAAHAAVEEQIFYPAAMADETFTQLHESVEEHLAVKRLIADLLELDPDTDDEDDRAIFDAKLALLEELVSHHAHDEEEAKLFPILERLWDDDQRAAIGNEVLAMFEQLMMQHPSQLVPAETAHAAQLPSL